MKRGILYAGLILSLIVLLIFAYALIFEYDLEVRPSIWYATVKDIFEQGDKSDIIMNSPPLEYNSRQEFWSNMEVILLLVALFILLIGLIIDMEKEYKKYIDDKYKSVNSFVSLEYMAFVAIAFFLSNRPMVFMNFIFPTYIALSVFTKALWIIIGQKNSNNIFSQGVIQ